MFNIFNLTICIPVSLVFRKLHVATTRKLLAREEGGNSFDEGDTGYFLEKWSDPYIQVFRETILTSFSEIVDRDVID